MRTAYVTDGLGLCTHMFIVKLSKILFAKVEYFEGLRLLGHYSGEGFRMIICLKDNGGLR